MQMKKGFACFMMIDCQWAYFTQVEKRNRIKEVLGEGKKGGKEQIKKDNLFFFTIRVACWCCLAVPNRQCKGNFQTLVARHVSGWN